MNLTAEQILALVKQYGFPPIDRQATKSKSAADCAVGPCDCDPHIETCEKCAPYLYETKPCVCGEPATPGVVHRTDGPCYVQEVTKPQEPVAIVELEEPDEPITWRRAKLTSLGLKLPHGAKLYTAPQPCPKCAFNVQELVEKQKYILQLETKCAELERNLVHWKNNHATVVAQARILKERTDMPIERVRAYEKWQETEKRCAELKEKLQEQGSAFTEFMLLDHPKALDERDRRIAELEAERDALNKIIAGYERDQKKIIFDQGDQAKTIMQQIERIAELRQQNALYQDEVEQLETDFNEQEVRMHEVRKERDALKAELLSLGRVR